MNLLEKMKKRGISTLEVHRVLEENNIYIPKRTLHQHLEKDVLNIKNEIAAEVVDFLIQQYDRTRIEVSLFVKRQYKSLNY